MMLSLLRPAVFAGLLAAILLSAIQAWTVSPLIVLAETYESAEPAVENTESLSAPALTESHEHAHEHEHEPQQAHEHQHDDDAWAPADGWQRTGFTFLSNLLMAVGFGLLLVAGFAWRQPRKTSLGLLWGLAGYGVFFVAPSLGLAPELPGTAAAELGSRQIWWASTALATALGLGLLVWAGHWSLKALGLLLLLVPHIWGAPQPEVHAALAPVGLQWRFIAMTSVANAAFWLVLGGAAAYWFRRELVWAQPAAKAG